MDAYIVEAWCCPYNLKYLFESNRQGRLRDSSVYSTINLMNHHLASPHLFVSAFPIPTFYVLCAGPTLIWFHSILL